MIHIETLIRAILRNSRCEKYFWPDPKTSHMKLQNKLHVRGRRVSRELPRRLYTVADTNSNIKPVDLLISKAYKQSDRNNILLHLILTLHSLETGHTRWCSR